MSIYTGAWIAWLVMFAVVEGWALFSREPGSTLSEHVWNWTRIKGKSRQWTWRRAALTAFLVWLLVHLAVG